MVTFVSIRFDLPLKTGVMLLLCLWKFMADGILGAYGCLSIVGGLENLNLLFRPLLNVIFIPIELGGRVPKKGHRFRQILTEEWTFNVWIRPLRTALC